MLLYARVIYEFTRYINKNIHMVCVSMSFEMIMHWYHLSWLFRRKCAYYMITKYQSVA